MPPANSATTRSFYHLLIAEEGVPPATAQRRAQAFVTRITRFRELAPPTASSAASRAWLRLGRCAWRWPLMRVAMRRVAAEGEVFGRCLAMPSRDNVVPGQMARAARRERRQPMPYAGLRDTGNGTDALPRRPIRSRQRSSRLQSSEDRPGRRQAKRLALPQAESTVLPTGGPRQRLAALSAAPPLQAQPLPRLSASFRSPEAPNTHLGMISCAAARRSTSSVSPRLVLRLVIVSYFLALSSV